MTVALGGRVRMPSRNATAPHPQRKLGNFFLGTDVAIRLIEGRHGGVAGWRHPRHQAKRFDLAMIRGGLSDLGVVLAFREPLLETTTLNRVLARDL
jgi:hypothetical protein